MTSSKLLPWAVLLTVVGLALSGGGIAMSVKKAQRVRSWPRHPAELVQAQLVTQSGEDYYGPDVVVRYTIDGRSATHRFTPSVWTDLRSAQKKLTALQARPTHTVSIDPAHPDELALDADSWSGEWSFGWLFLAGFGGLVLFTACIFWLGMARFWSVRIVPPVFMTVGVIIVAGALYGAARMHAKSRWPEVEAKIDDIDRVKQDKDAEDTTALGDNYLYAPRARVHYDVDGKRYDTWVVGSFVGGTVARKSVERRMEQWRQQPWLTLRYSPSDPLDAYYGGVGYWFALVFLGVGALFFGLGWLTRRLLAKDSDEARQRAAS